MAKKGNLFFLIKSLSKAEKRYFKHFCFNNKKNENYLRLFKAYNEMVQLDEDLIKKKFAGEIFARQLHVTKNYLYQLILKSLRNYHNDLSANAQIKDILRNVEILFHKELYNHCHYEIIRAERLALAFEQYQSLIEIISWKRRLLLTTRGSALVELNKLTLEEKRFITRLNRQNELWHLTANIFDYQDDPQEKLLRLPAIKEVLPTDSISLKILHCHILYTYYTFNGKSERGNQQLVQLIDILENYPKRIQGNPGAYVTALNNLISSYIFQKQYDLIWPLLKKVKAVPGKYQLRSDSQFTIKLHLRTYNLELELYRDTRQLQKGIQLVHEIEAFIAKRKLDIPFAYLIQFWYQFAYIYFMNRQFPGALKWVNEIINLKSSKERQDLQSYARLLNLIIHFEMGNTFVLKYAVDSCRRFFKKKDKMAPFEKELLRFFSKLSNAPQATYQLLFKELENTLFNDKHLLVDANILDYLNFRHWISDHLSGNC